METRWRTSAGPMRYTPRPRAFFGTGQKMTGLALVLAAMALISCGASTDSSADTAVNEATEAATEQVTAPEPTTAAPEPSVASTPTTGSEIDEPTADLIDGYDAPGTLVVPDPLEPGAPGQLIASESFAIKNLTGLAMQGQRLLYHSRSAVGDDIAVSGFVVYPDGPPPEGGWPLIAWAHGTTGIADVCAPSAQSSPVGDYSNQTPLRLVAEGFAVVATDYEGLGTPGRHPYIVGASEAHSVFDSVRAVANMELPVSEEWIAFGYSQGGHAAMFTAQLHPSYAPELELLGTIAGAPPSQTSFLLDWLIGGEYQGFVPMVIAGNAAAFAEIDLADVLTPEAFDLLDVVDTDCYGSFDVFNPLPWEDIELRDDVLTAGPFAERLAEQDTNRLPTRQPLMIIHGGADDLIPAETSAMLVDQLCALDGQAPVQRIVYPGQAHGGSIDGEAAWPDLLDWVGARFAGEPAPDDCPQ